MKKSFFVFSLLFLCMFCSFFGVENAFAQNTQEIYVVTANRASVFESADFASAKVGQIEHDEEVYVQMEDAAPQEFENEGFVFYKITHGELEGYVFADLLTPKNNVITAIPSFNGQTNTESKVFWKQDNEMVESDITLSKGERIFLYEGFNGKEEFNAIAFVHENKVLYGYLKTDTISPDGINPAIITCIIIIIALLGIIFAWLFMKNKKVKLKKQKSSHLKPEN